MSMERSEVKGPVLVGLRGSGKSTIGPRAARALGLTWMDADAEIERDFGAPIPEIFQQRGEKGFRDLEKGALLSLLALPGVLLGTGGGAVLHPEVRKALLGRFTVWLTGPVSILASRIAGSDRPSLTGRPVEEELSAMASQREALYREVATLVVDTGLLSPDQSAEAIRAGFLEAQARAREGGS